MKKRIVSIVLTMLMILSLLPCTAFAAASSIVVGGKTLPSGYYLGSGKTYVSNKKPSGGYAYYKDGVLTLHNYEFQSEGYKFSGQNTAAIYCKGALTVKLEGENVVVNTSANGYNHHVDDFAIYATGNLNFKGGDEDVLVTLSTAAAIYSAKSITANGGVYGFAGNGSFPERGFLAKEGTISMTNCAVVPSKVRYETFEAYGDITLTDCWVYSENTGCMFQTNDGDVTISGGYLEAYVSAEFFGCYKNGKNFCVLNGAEVYVELTNTSTGRLFYTYVDQIVMDETVNGYKIDPHTDAVSVLTGPTGCKIIHIAPSLHYHTNDGKINFDNEKHWVECGDPECPVAVDGVVYEEHVYPNPVAIECAVCNYIRTIDGVVVGGVQLTDGDYLAVGAEETAAQQPDGGYAHYDDGVLTLHDYSYSGPGAEYRVGHAAAAIFAMRDLHIVLEGENSIIVEPREDITGNHGVHIFRTTSDVAYDLNITGDGSLTVNAPSDIMYVYGNLTMDGVTVNADSGRFCIVDGNVDIRNSAVNTTGQFYVSSSEGEVFLRGSSMTASDLIAFSPVDIENTKLTLTDPKEQTAKYKRLVQCEITSLASVKVTEGIVDGSKVNVSIWNNAAGLDLKGESASITDSIITIKTAGNGITGEGELTVKDSDILAESGHYGVDCPSSLTVENSSVLLTSSRAIYNKNYYALRTNGLVLVNDADEMTAAIDFESDMTEYVAEENNTYAVVRITPEGRGYKRIFGNNRAATALEAADELKRLLGVEKFSAVILASGTNFADALAGSCLAGVESAPILLYTAGTVQDTIAYIGENLDLENGVVYLLGGTSAVPEAVEAELAATGVTVDRVYGNNRFSTNLEILRAAGVTADQEILVCTGYNFADSLSASATGLPILLVNSKKGTLDKEQKAYLEELSAGGALRLTIIGGTGAVGENLEKQLMSYGTVVRVYGDSRYTTSVAIAERYFDSFDKACLAYGKNFPDGLCGGPLAYVSGAPLLLVEGGKESIPADFLQGVRVTDGYVLGGTGVVSDYTAVRVFR